MATLIEYTKAGLKYERLEEFEAGMELFGPEVKALKGKQGSLEGAQVVVRGGEAYVVGMSIPPYQSGNTPKGYDPERARRLLLKKDQIRTLFTAESIRGLTIVPIEVYTKDRLIKLRIAVVRIKVSADRREDLKKRDAAREARRILKSR